MSKMVSGFLKGIGTGVAVGIAAGVAGTMVYHSNRKGFKKAASKTVKAIGGFMDDVQHMMK